ncbi:MULTISPECIES: deoxyguanosinetriphosphate triphosphohydrolase [Kitasatospora]|uniref:Deoxyguanosinetriphosphate triphosphohydrolase-like protein n=1 Tax=Kitasatospora setae (strain ATCC 33774 / DSM 43861 / JCM 3304 / KCC A-0304 / NBRC 14216 / KM-6054) TaxID=452652 RepID=E4NAU9_KITSK|nr:MULTISPECIES: deoxyguanosinetriphosphate triphosphohydrolase [Kitasatospora]BAJ28330.1 putative deoxyguanosinetriphosphate triphosphohydrolase-like protein [Kitasatospora setae KM-6054]
MKNTAPYDPQSEARWVPEPDKRPGRTAFQRDRARVLHSAALRRLAGTTQVVAPMRSDFPRTRLTHSLECAQVGRELGAALGCDPDLVETACLAHDIGHPPFGHTGEEALDQAAAACGGFEGNAQSLRILTRLEPKRFAPPDEPAVRLAPWPGRSVGLNLTRAALDAATKYPWARGRHPADPGSTKYGVYGDDLPVFRWLRSGAPDGRKCFEATVMDWSDDVAYSTHDVEDGLQAGHIDPAALRSAEERAELFKIAERFADAGEAEFAEALDRLRAQDWWPAGYDGTARARAGLKDLTSQLIGRFCLAAEQATRARYGPGPLTRYAAELVVPRGVRVECAVLKAVAVRYVMQRDEQAQLRSRQRVVIAELAEVLLNDAPHQLDPVFAAQYEEAEDDRAALRTVIDQIATLTDASALALHARLVP